MLRSRPQAATSRRLTAPCMAHGRSRDTKQQVAVISDLDAHEVARALLPPEPPTPPAAPPVRTRAGASEHSGGEPQAVAGELLPATSCAGALILRGNRCVLVRSLESPPEWPGMRLPFVELDGVESAVEGAIRAASEQ